MTCDKPLPMTRTARPPEIAFITEMSLATTLGWRVAGFVHIVASRVRLVCPAAVASETKESLIPRTP
jgi:hypothetical protein